MKPSLHRFEPHPLKPSECHWCGRRETAPHLPPDDAA